MPRQPIDPAVQRRAEDLLSRGNLSQREVASRVGVSKTTIREIDKRRLDRLAGGQSDEDPALVIDENRETIVPGGVRCECGALVKVVPCRSCRMRDTVGRFRDLIGRLPPKPRPGPRRPRRRKPAEDGNLKLAVELRPEEQARLDELRLARGFRPD